MREEKEERGGERREGEEGCVLQEGSHAPQLHGVVPLFSVW